jgi:hypothetical protein
MKRLLTLALCLLLPVVAAAQGVGGGPGVWQSKASPAGYISGGAWVNTQPFTLAAGQGLTLCNTADCVTNYERGGVRWSGNFLEIFTEKGGTGSNRNISLNSAGGNFFAPTIQPLSDDTYSLGAAAGKYRTLFASRGLQGAKSTTLTDAGAAVTIERVAVPTNGYMQAATFWTANSTDGTNRLVTGGIVTWAAADTAGTVTCGAPVVTGLVTAYKRGNTLLCTFTAATSTTNCDLQVTCTDNMAAAQTMAIEHFPIMPTTNSYAPQ